jgi:hypothetical protein
MLATPGARVVDDIVKKARTLENGIEITSP